MQEAPFVVDVVTQPEAARDISLDVVLGMFAMAGVVLLVAVLGGLIVGAIFVGIRRLRERRSPPTNTNDLRLRI